MSPELAEKRYTVEQFEFRSESEHHELVDGIPVEKSMGSAAGSVTTRLLLRTVPAYRLPRA